MANFLHYNLHMKFDMELGVLEKRLTCKIHLVKAIVDYWRELHHQQFELLTKIHDKA